MKGLLGLKKRSLHQGTYWGFLNLPCGEKRLFLKAVCFGHIHGPWVNRFYVRYIATATVASLTRRAYKTDLASRASI